MLVCVACFLVVSPILVMYSMGYRFDFSKMKITLTGGIYVRTFPTAEQIIIDSDILEKPNIFSNSIFVQSLLPDDHTVLVKKNGYYDYFKTLPVLEKEVTKLENILLFKKNMAFEVIENPQQTTEGLAKKIISPFDSQEKYIIKNSNLYYSNSPENSNLSAIQKSNPLLKKIIAFELKNNYIVWLGLDGFLYRSDLNNLSLNPVKIILTPIKIVKAGYYKIISDDKNTFINNNGSLLFFNDKTNELDNFYNKVKDAKISPDGKNISYFTDRELYVSSTLTDQLPTSDKGTLLYKSPETITDCVWLNNDYVIIASANRIIISEIDYRGNINAISLPQIIETFTDDKVNIKNPEIFFNQQEGRLYILSNKTLLTSEKITQ